MEEKKDDIVNTKVIFTGPTVQVYSIGSKEA